jgi:hypothetical protein
MDEEKELTAKTVKKLVREGDFVAEVDVHLIEMEGAWTPCVSVDDAYKLDDVRDALQTGNLKRAAQLASRIYRLTPVEA